MKKVKIKYNPYLLKTEIEIDGKKPKPNSKLNFGNLRVQEWSTRLPQILIDEASDKNFDIEFTGTETDYNDFKTAIDDSGKITATLHAHIQPSVNEVEEDIDKIFKEIQEGPVASLKDESILEAFKKAKNQEFEINVVATMSSGKSTLINALIDKKLMPVANMATTATIVRIIDTPMPEEFDAEGNKLKRFDAVAYDSKGNKVREQENITYRIMKDWNSDSSISSIDIYGEIPCVESIGMRLVLVDTPGPNNSQDESHRTMTYQMLEDSDKSLVLFVMNARQLNINDQKNFMDYVCKCMREGGKQSRERYIFAINQMDGYDPEDEEPEDALKSAKEVLEDYHITSPNLFPVSALAALECRTNPEIKTALPVFAPRVKRYPEMKFDSYYNYNNLPISSRHKIENMLNECETDEERIEIHSGIYSIEEAIGLYIDKYARALKVKDLVDSFNNRLQELNAIAMLQEEVRNNKEKKEILDKKIEEIQRRIDSGRSAQTLSRLIDKKDLSVKVETDIIKDIQENREKIRAIVKKYDTESEVEKSKALNLASTLEKESKDILSQVDAKISSILEKGFKDLYEDIINEYKSYLNDLGLSSTYAELAFKPLDFVAEDIQNLNELLKQNSKIVDEGYDETRTRTVKGEKKTNWFWTPWNWGSERYEERKETYKVHIPNNVEYVNMSQVVSSYFEPIQEQLVAVQKAARSHASFESQRVKQSLKDYLYKIDSILQEKMSDLRKSVDTANQTQKDIETQEANLKWMGSIIDRVNKLINF